MAVPEPTASVRAFFAHHLKRLREQAKLSQTELGDRVPCSKSMISAMETCTRTPSLRICQGLDRVLRLPMYFEGLYPRVIEETGIPAGFPEFAEVEAGANVINLYEPFAITGLFQTEDYARAVVAAARQSGKIDQMVAERMRRQEVLERDDPPQVFALLDESAIHRPFGSVGVMMGQLQRLLKLMERPNIHINIVPMDAGIWPEGGFSLLSVAGEPDVAYGESVGGFGRLIDSAHRVAEVNIWWGLVRDLALSTQESAIMIREALEKLESE